VSQLRGCDVVSLKVEDVAPHGYAVDRATVRQSKTGRPVRFQITEHARQAIDEHLAVARKRPGDFLFNGRGGKHRCLTTREYARLLSRWIASVGLDPSLFGTHSLRRTKATLIDRRTDNLRAVQLLLGHTKVGARQEDRHETLRHGWLKAAASGQSQSPAGGTPGLSGYGNGYAEDMAADALIASAEIGLTAATASAPSAEDAGQNPAESDIPKSGNLSASGGPLSSGSGQSTPPAPSDPAMPGLGNPGTGKAVAGGQPSSSGNRKSAAPTGGKAPLSGPGKPKESPPSLALLKKKAPPAPKVILGPFDD
jgi:Phage integrase family